MTWEKICYNRNILYEQVWSQATLAVAKSYGISNVGLAKICKRLKVPLPGRGYWARLRHGKVVRKQPLPQLPPGEPEEYVSERRAKPMLEQSQATEFELAACSEKQVERKIVVPQELTEPHSLVGLAGKNLRHSGRDQNGLLKPRNPG